MSLIEPPREQLQLPVTIPEERWAAFEREAKARNPQFTAARFFSRFPDSYREITGLLGEQVPQRVISRMYCVSTNTISAIARREAGTEFVEASRKEAAAHYRHLSRLGRERAQEMLEDPKTKIQLQALALSVGIFESKAGELAGDLPAQRVVVEQPALDRFTELLARARAEAHRMGLGGEAAREKDAGAVAAGGGVNGLKAQAGNNADPVAAALALPAGFVQVGEARPATKGGESDE